MGSDVNYVFNTDPISIWLAKPEGLNPKLPPVIKMIGEEFDKAKPGMAIRSAHVGMAASNTRRLTATKFPGPMLPEPKRLSPALVSTMAETISGSRGKDRPATDGGQIYWPQIA